MNRILVFIVILLVPIVIMSENISKERVEDEYENHISLEIPVSSEETKSQDKELQVMLSDKSDKSEAFSMDLEDYVIGVVAGEMPASFSVEALKAQAVASRTFALYKMNSNQNYVLSTTINDQVYLTKEDMQKNGVMIMSIIIIELKKL